MLSMAPLLSDVVEIIYMDIFMINATFYCNELWWLKVGEAAVLSLSFNLGVICVRKIWRTCTYVEKLRALYFYAFRMIIIMIC